MARNTTLEEIAHWAAQVPCDWPKTSIAPVVHAITDTVACMVSGATDEAAKRVRTTVDAWSVSSGGATIIGSGSARLLLLLHSLTAPLHMLKILMIIFLPP